MDNMDSMKKMPADGQQPRSIPVQNPNFDPADFIKRATGLNIDPENLPVTPAAEHPEHQPIGTVPLTRADEYHPTMQNPAANTDADEWVKLSSESTDDGVKQKRVEAMAKEQDDMATLLDIALDAEDARVKRAEEITSSPENAQQFYAQGGSADVAGGTPKVKYDNVPMEQRASDKTFNPVADEAASEIDTDDLVPSYGAEEEPEESTDPAKANDSGTDKKKSKEEDEAPDMEDEVAYAAYIQGLDVAVVPEGNTVVRTVKNRQLDVETKDNKSGKFIGDQSFLNSITRFKKDNFTVVSVPMVNSGFVLDVVGTGGVDLTQLYTRVNRETSQMDYEIEKMKAIMKNVVGTHPRIDPMQLKKYIHYRDYNMMAWGHICATLDNVEIVANCDDCGKPFRITSSPRALLMNMDEILKRQAEIEAADDINRYSLLTSNRQIITSNMFEITIGHPNYAEIINQMGQLRKYAQQLNQIEASHFIQKAQILYQIRQIKLPNGVITSNIYQTYLALTLLNDTDYQILVEEIDQMQKDIVEPKFGISSVKCPHCGYVLHDVPYENLDELVFFHTTVSRMLRIKQTEKPENMSTNG